MPIDKPSGRSVLAVKLEPDEYAAIKRAAIKQSRARAEAGEPIAHVSVSGFVREAALAAARRLKCYAE